MELSEHQRLFLAAVCKYFHETGTWPTYGMIDKALRPYKSLDVEEIGKELDTFMHDSIHAPLVGWDPNHAIAMNVSALYRCQKEGICPELSQDLEAFALLVRLCIDRYEAGKEELPITSDDLLDGDSLISLEVMGNVIRIVEVEGFFTNIGSDEDSSRGRPIRWTLKMSNSIRKYRDVRTIEDYLAVRKTLQTAAWSSLKVVLKR
jgi:hypothetical protein